MNRETRQRILSLCPEYHNISNYLYQKRDGITRRLISEYQEFVFSVDIDDYEDKKKLLAFNKVMEEYISNHKFAQALRNYLKAIPSDLKKMPSKELIQSILDFKQKYEDEALKQISITKWL